MLILTKSEDNQFLISNVGVCSAISVAAVSVHLQCKIFLNDITPQATHF